MKDARFTVPTPALLSRVVDTLDDVPMHDRDTNGDLYEYVLSKPPGAWSRTPGQANHSFTRAPWRRSSPPW